MKVILSILFLATSCVSPAPKTFDVSQKTVVPGSQVTVSSQSTPLYKGSLKVGDNFSQIAHAQGIKVEPAVSVINIVPSIDTAVCEAQTHLLGETESLGKNIQKITISRDLPMAQMRFAEAAGLKNIIYFSDYKTGSFGKSTGLMMKGPELLARAVIVTDAKGIIRHMQIVPDVSTLPDLEKAFQIANSLAAEDKVNK